MVNFSQELTEKPAIVVSRHHGKLKIEDLSIVFKPDPVVDPV
jgi:hypothetical protein